MCWLAGRREEGVKKLLLDWGWVALGGVQARRLGAVRQTGW
jgi:hypothetical protein